MNAPTMPAFLDSSPAAELVAEYRKLTRLQVEGDNRRRKLEEERQRAADRDRKARADALRAGKKDPGDQHAQKHQSELAAAEREAETARLAAAQCRKELRDRLAEPDAAHWAADLARANAAAAERALAALTEAAEAFAEIQTGAGQAAYAEQALASCRREQRSGHTVRWPTGTPRRDLVKIRVGEYKMTPESVLNLLAAAASDATEPDYEEAVGATAA